MEKSVAKANKIAADIAALKIWDQVTAHNWAVVSMLSEKPFVISVFTEKEGPVLARLMIFPGFEVFRDFQFFRRIPAFGTQFTPGDFRHWEIVAVRGGGVNLFSFAPGYLPRVWSDEEASLLIPVINECYGLMMRIEEEPELPLKFFRSGNAMFSRKEALDGSWKDAPLPLPETPQVAETTQVKLSKAMCEKAAGLPFSNDVVWEFDFLPLPQLMTREEHPRAVYLMAAVNASTGQRIIWRKLSVRPNAGDEGLRELWEALASALLTAAVTEGYLPGSVSVRSPRVMKFLRPLAIHVPFKMVRHAKLPALDLEITKANSEGVLKAVDESDEMKTKEV